MLRKQNFRGQFRKNFGEFGRNFEKIVRNS